MLSFCSLVCLLFVGACRLLRLVQPDGFIDLLRLEDEEEKEGEEGRRGEEEEGEEEEEEEKEEEEGEKEEEEMTVMALSNGTDQARHYIC